MALPASLAPTWSSPAGHNCLTCAEVTARRRNLRIVFSTGRPAPFPGRSRHRRAASRRPGRPPGAA
ncbi:hypothetical protein SGM_4645 [Streptomyces griseoaurantiacus M045]|uniref:Uncharacterized protein n=1 Tax=Streptomyces griseoaurantiacus M045 TaxID=996637 RepID=F3NND1_9ACTN|nr:hypothetical protein SGM_4645 [Streptomyces griseoaurantiacus M045]